MCKEAVYTDLLDFLDRLQSGRVPYRLRYSVPRAISVDVDLPDGRWEVDFDEDGGRDIEKFVSRGGVGGAEMWNELLSSIADCEDEQRETEQNNGVDAGRDL